MDKLKNMDKLNCNYSVQGNYSCSNNKDIHEPFQTLTNDNAENVYEIEEFKSIISNYDRCKTVSVITNEGINKETNDFEKYNKNFINGITTNLQFPIINNDNTYNPIVGNDKLTGAISDSTKKFVLINASFELSDDTLPILFQNSLSELKSFFRTSIKLQFFLRIRIPGASSSQDISISELIPYNQKLIKICQPINIIIYPNISFQIIPKIFINPPKNKLPVSQKLIALLPKILLPTISYNISGNFIN